MRSSGETDHSFRFKKQGARGGTIENMNTSPDKITEQNRQMWDARAKNYDRYFWFTHWDKKKLISLLTPGESLTLLDLACGPGSALRYAARRYRGKGEFYGIDISANMIKAAEKNPPVSKTSISTRRTPLNCLSRTISSTISSARMRSTTFLPPVKCWRKRAAS